ncbi:MAG: MATE family efflux transporter [Spirochaetes bacterium]|nr:MATE family efflux transporter [Spirochaetota bacterium]
MTQKFGKDLTTGSIPRHLLQFSIPMLIGNIIQVGHSIVNTIWVGHLVGKDAVGAVGVSTPVLFILIGISMGITMATTILVAQYYGAKNYEMVNTTVNNSFSLAIIVAVLLVTLGIIYRDNILIMLNTPVNNFEMASGYLKVSFLAFIPIYIVVLISSILRGIGDTVTPLIFMAIGVGINIILDPFLIGGWSIFPHNGLIGAAYATLVAQIIAMVLCIVYLNRKEHVIALNPRKLALNRKMTSIILKIGFPSMIQQSLVSLSALFVVTFVNAFGAAATNAFGAVGRIDMVAIMPALSMSMAASTLTGQNLGAKKPERVKEVFKWGVIMSATITIMISLFAILFSNTIFAMFGLANDAEVVEIGTSYLRIAGSCYIFFAVMFITNGIANGSGHTLMTMFFSLFSLWVVRVPFSWILSKTSLGVTGIWIAVALSFFVTMIISFAYYFSGRWKKSVIRPTKIETPVMD